MAEGHRHSLAGAGHSLVVRLGSLEGVGVHSPEEGGPEEGMAERSLEVGTHRVGAPSRDLHACHKAWGVIAAAFSQCSILAVPADSSGGLERS